MLIGLSAQLHLLICTNTSAYLLICTTTSAYLNNYICLSAQLHLLICTNTSAYLHNYICLSAQLHLLMRTTTSAYLHNYICLCAQLHLLICTTTTSVYLHNNYICLSAQQVSTLLLKKKLLLLKLNTITGGIEGGGRKLHNAAVHNLYSKAYVFFLKWPDSPPGLPHSRSFYFTHNDVPQLVGLLWTSDQLVAETSDNTQQSQQRDIHGSWDSNPSLSRIAAAVLRLRPRGHWDQQAYINKGKGK